MRDPFLVQAGHGLVEKEGGGLQGKGDGDLEKPPFTMADFRNPFPVPRVETNPLEALSRQTPQFPVPGDGSEEPHALSQASQVGKHDVLQNRELRDEGRDLKGARHSEAGPLGGTHLADVAALETDGPAVRGEVAGHLPDEGGLAGSVGTDQRMDLSGDEIERDGVIGPDGAEASGQAGDVEHDRRHVGLSRHRGAARRRTP